jgi:hypothetical protein
MSVDERRLRSLFNAGWTLQAIGDAFIPPRTRSTVRYWAMRQHTAAVLPDEIPKPRYRVRGYVPRRPKSPGIPDDIRERIASLSRLARRYRSKMNPLSSEALANDELTSLCASLHESSVPVRELAEAAGVTYRAMARRLGR